MSQPLTRPLAPTTASDCFDRDGKPGWISRVREAIVRDAQAIRRTGLTIEAQSLWNDLWHPIMLPSGRCQFATEEDAATVLKMLQGIDPVGNVETGTQP